MSFDCKYKQKDEQCRRLNRRCSPGDPGCTLNQNFEFPIKEKKEASEKKKK